VNSSKRRLRHEDGGFCGGCAAGGRWSFCALASGIARSIHATASASFSEISRKNWAVRFSVSGATSFLYKTLHAREFLVNSLSKSSKFLMLLIRELFVDALAELFEFVHK